jgi:thymidylate synthase (FAD)
MSARVVSYTQTPDGKTLLEQIAYVARVSNPENQESNDTAERLVRYLMRNKHWSPFEMVNVCLEVETTRDIARQFLRHRSFSFQEFSQRYAVGTKLGFDTREARLQDHKNRQNSIEVCGTIMSVEWARRQLEVIDAARETYDWAIENGIAKEQARVILPEGLTRTRMYVNGSVRSWIHYLELRLGNGTQKEHREVAHACACALREIFPCVPESV